MTENKIDLTPGEFEAAHKTNMDSILLDVRTPEEFGSGHLPGAINININGFDFHEQVDELDPNTEYFIYCRSGARSATACRYMQSKGIKNVHNLVGGILAWRGDIEQ
jgi:phage shock protein E